LKTVHSLQVAQTLRINLLLLFDGLGHLECFLL